MLRSDVADLTGLDLLSSVAELGSLGKAALRHGLSQPAVSMRMTSLERRLGLKLLLRDPSGTRLTPAGAQVVAASRRLLAEAEMLASTVDRLQAERRSHIRVAASFTVAEHLLLAWIETFQQQSPEVALTLEVVNSSRVLEAVGAGRVDIGFIEGVDRSLPGLAAETLSTDHLVVVVSPDHPWATRATSISAEKLAATDLIVRERGSGTREVLEEALSPYGGVRSRLALGSSEALILAARRNEGPAVLSELAAAEHVEAGRLVVVPVQGLDLTRHIRAVWPEEVGLNVLARRLLSVASPKPD